MIKPVNTPKTNGVVCSKIGVKGLLYEENIKKRVVRHFFGCVVAAQLNVWLYSVPKSRLYIKRI
jgi:hypothetical protein